MNNAAIIKNIDPILLEEQIEKEAYKEGYADAKAEFELINKYGE